MLKQIAAILLLAAFTLQTFTGIFVLADYYANTSAYAKNCVNKARPKLNCNGKCFMMKKMREEEKKEQENAERKCGNKNEIVSSRSFFPTVVTPTTIITSDQKITVKSMGTSKDRSLDVFHPPQA